MHMCACVVRIKIYFISQTFIQLFPASLVERLLSPLNYIGVFSGKLIGCIYVGLLASIHIFHSSICFYTDHLSFVSRILVKPLEKISQDCRGLPMTGSLRRF